MIRYYYSPMTTWTPPSGGIANIPKAVLIANSVPNCLANAVAGCNPDGTLKNNWALVRVDSPDWTAFDADTTIYDILQKVADVANTNKSTIITWLKTKTVGDLSTTIKNTVQTKLTALGVDLTGVTNTTLLFDVLRRVHAVHSTGKLEDM